MRRLLKYLASAAMLLSPLTAHSADIAVKSPPPPLVPVFSWTGFYLGGNIGGAWANNAWTDNLFLTSFNNGNNGNNGVFIGGFQAGFNYQIGSFVIGFETDLDWAGNNGGRGIITPAGNILVSSNDHSITTAAARFGYAIDHWMLYGKVGGGWVANGDFTVTNLTTGASLTCGHFTITCSESVGGWLVGAGFEYAVTNNWTVKLEYDYLGLGNRTILIPATAPTLAGDTFTSNNRNVQMIKVGFNYLFNWGAPIAARY